MQETDDKKTYEELLEENKRLKALLKKHGIFYITPDKLLNTDQKCAVFFDYFFCRKDLYAEHYYSQKSDKFGWNPACANNFQTGCMKKQGKYECFKCQNASFKKLNDKVLMAHLTGKEENGRPNYGIGL